MKRSFIIACLFCIGVNIAWSQEVKKVKITEVEKLIAGSNGPLIVNFWATFCKPCMEEIPHFQAMVEKYRKEGLQLVFVSLDMQDAYPAKVSAFTRKRKMTSWWLDETDADYFCPKIDPSWSGVIPATVFVNNSKSYRKFTEEAITATELEKEVQALLSKAN